MSFLQLEDHSPRQLNPILLQQGDLAVGLYSNATMHTPINVTQEALARAKELGVDCCVSVGGGSTIGLGKALALYSPDDAKIKNIVIPTTCQCFAGSRNFSPYADTRSLPRQMLAPRRPRLSVRRRMTRTGNRSRLRKRLSRCVHSHPVYASRQPANSTGSLRSCQRSSSTTASSRSRCRPK